MDEQYVDQYFTQLFNNRERLHTDEQFVRELLASHLSHLPKKLYKYRAFNKKNLSSLASSQIYLPCANTFPDPFDYTLHFDIQEQSEKIWEFFSSKNVLPKIVYNEMKKALSASHIKANLSLRDVEFVYERYYQKDGTKLSQRFENEIVRRANVNDKIGYRIIIKNMNEFFDKNSEQTKAISMHIAEQIYDTCQHPRNNNIIYCLTEENDNRPLWENYAKNYTGYCIEYDFSSWEEKPLDVSRLLLGIVPVSYHKGRIPFNIDPFFRLAVKQFLLNESPTTEERLPLEIDIMKQLLRKEAKYSYENEWRLIIESSEAKTLLFPFIGAIYLGKDMAPHNEARLLTIAKRLEVPIYKQKMSFYGNELRFEEIKR